MTGNPAAILGLIADLYAQVAALTEENQRLRRELVENQAPPTD